MKTIIHSTVIALAAALALASFTAAAQDRQIESTTAHAARTPAPFFPLAPATVSTVPSNGDVNPYGVFFTQRNILSDGVLQPGDILVSNFNNKQNLQGTGTTITRVARNGEASTFFQGKNGLGLTAALGAFS